MIKNSREDDHSYKEECNTPTNNKQPRNFYSTWSGLKNPRIVRVSRAFGGKDRHSKVTTIRGLRDRRIRLSVQTAIQLYDLQDKLGFNQPSKVVDWLINAAQHEIDKLPPLQMPPGNFIPFPQFMNPSMNISENNRVQVENAEIMKENSIDNSLHRNTDVYTRIRSKESMKERVNENQASSSKTNVEENQSFIMPSNSTSQIPYSFSDSMNAYMYYSATHSSQPEVHNPVPLFGTNFDGKNYSHFHLSSLFYSSQENQDFKNQRTQEEEHGNN
ncbi:hypothetical protein LUZ60_005842 [Juncus effusus]|nr:hypothetical protein LUZ60_005842 [Juncus effusus]